MTRRDDTVVPFPRPTPDGHDLFDRFVQDVEIDPHSPMMRHILRARETNRTPTKSPEPVDRHRTEVGFDFGGVDETRVSHWERRGGTWLFQGTTSTKPKPGRRRRVVRKNDGRHWWRMARLAVLISSGVIGYGLIGWGLYLIF